MDATQRGGVTATGASLSSPLVRALVVYVAVPVAIGLLFGWMKTGRTALWPMPASIGFWIAISWPAWLLCDAGCRLAALMLRPWRQPLWLVLLVGALLVQGLVYPVNRAVAEVFQLYFVVADLHRPLPDLAAAAALKSSLPGVLLWIGFNLWFFYALGIPRYGFVPGGREAAADGARELGAAPLPAIAAGERAGATAGAADAGGAPAVALGASPLLARLPERLGDQLLAISAEEHYLKVWTARGTALVLYRMGDAVRELRATGLQVHRSWWVAHAAVERVERSQGQMTLKLRNGIAVPVSRTFRRAVEDAGYAAGQAPRGGVLELAGSVVPPGPPAG